MATTNVSFWLISVLSLAQPFPSRRRLRICRRSLTPHCMGGVVPFRSRGSLSQLLSWLSMLAFPPIQRIIRSFRRRRRFWAAPREKGFWEKDVCGLWRSMGSRWPDWEEKQYLQHFRMTKDTFWYLCNTYGRFFTNTLFTWAQFSVKTTGPGLMTWACGLSGPVYTFFFDIPVK